MNFHEKAMLDAISSCIAIFNKENETNEMGLNIIKDALQELYRELEEHKKEEIRKVD